ncbi:MAG: FAD-dependent monooxygenase [Dermatophilaceae bacterium]
MSEHQERTTDPSPTRTAVLVIGAGPGGLVTALVLARYGVDVLLVDKRQETSTLSRALAISTRTMGAHALVGP